MPPNFASLDDFRKKDEDEEKGKATESFTGGAKSGLAVENPDDRWKRMQDLFEQQSGGAGGPIPRDHTLVTIYRNGFTVDRGTYRPLSDPLNKKFLDDIAVGRCPAELQAGHEGAVHVAVEDKRTEDYKEPAPPPYVKFSGDGVSLGGSSSSAAAPVQVQAGAGSVEVDNSRPKAKIQVRFHDGQRKAQEFNESHTVGDLRSFCQQCAGGEAMAIMGGFPPKPLLDDSQTLKDAGLLGAQVTARPL